MHVEGWVCVLSVEAHILFVRSFAQVCHKILRRLEVLHAQDAVQMISQLEFRKHLKLSKKHLS